MMQYERQNKDEIKDRLRYFRDIMKEEQIDYYIIPTGDDHQSEYVGDHYKVREYMSGFTGSAGTLLICADMAGLWTDGRYFIQAERELHGSGIKLFRMQEEGVLSLQDYLASHVEDGDVIGFDGTIVSASFKEGLMQAISNKAEIRTNTDLADRIWERRPERSEARIVVLPESIAGKSIDEKLAGVRSLMAEYQAAAVLLSALDDIMWLYNLRGSDVQCNPVALSFAYITLQEAWLFAAPEAVTGETEQYLREHHVIPAAYERIYDFLIQRPEQDGNRLLLDEHAVSLALYEASERKHEIMHVPVYRLIPKAVKNTTEIRLCKVYHLADAVAVTKFLYWLKTHPKLTEETELSVSEKLETFRREQEGYRGSSFETIAAYGENASMIHYSPTKETDTRLQKNGMLLLDSGGQYYGATTDITRTVVLGKISMDQKEQYTAVVSGMLSLANAKFMYGCTGRSMDILARESLWKMGLDYRHGTGHGVGSYLSVHEGPQAFRWKQSETLPEVVLEPGMVITDEPGYYEAGSHGIRIENELLCIEREDSVWGRYLGFEILTYVPIDLEAILPEKMNNECKNLLNVYHREVYKRLCPFLTDSEKKWLFSQTREI